MKPSKNHCDHSFFGTLNRGQDIDSRLCGLNLIDHLQQKHPVCFSFLFLFSLSSKSLLICIVLNPTVS